MYPQYRSGDMLLVLKIKHYRCFSVGTNVVVSHPEFGLIVKQVARYSSQYLTLTGLNSQSVSESQMGKVPWDLVRGRVVFHIPLQ